MGKDPKGQEDRPTEASPDKRKLTKLQAKRLSELARVDAKELVGKRIVKIHEDLRWHIDPELLLFRRVCGRVVKRDPATGDLQPVPNATVHVEDTDCSFLIFSPPLWPDWCWFFPLICHREEIATATTDHCGRFCVWIPRWEIDWVVRWVRGHICFPRLVRPRLRDLLERLQLELPDPPVLRWPPLPDPPELALQRPETLERVRQIAGHRFAEQLEGLIERHQIGLADEELGALVETPLIPLPPPVPKELRTVQGEAAEAESLAAVPEGLELAEDHLRHLRYDRWVGPFWRCVDVVLGLWTPVWDVPDITFSVTQDVDGDGDEETIYSEGFFDVRWNAGAIPDVTLEASAIALSTPNCHGPEIDPGDCTEPTILTAGLMPLRLPQFNIGTGYARRINRPRPGGLSTSPQAAIGEAPLWRTIQLHGCHRFPGAHFYRLVYSYEGLAEVPFTGVSWWAPRFGAGPPFHIVPDSDGWYPILPAADLVFPHWLFNWESWRYANGRYGVRLILGDAAKAVTGESGPVELEVDNTRPSGGFTQLRWRAPGLTPWQVLPLVCPVIRRPAGADIELEVTYNASAPHFRNVYLLGYGCGAGNMVKTGPASDFDHWHTDPGDNSWTATAVFEVPGTRPEGAYTVGLNINGRAFNPAGGDAGPSTNWIYDVVYSWRHPRHHLAIIDT